MKRFFPFLSVICCCFLAQQLLPFVELSSLPNINNSTAQIELTTQSTTSSSSSVNTDIVSTVHENINHVTVEISSNSTSVTNSDEILDEITDAISPAITQTTIPTVSPTKRAVLIEDSLVVNSTESLQIRSAKEVKPQVDPTLISYRLRTGQSPYDVPPYYYPREVYEGPMYSENVPYSYDAVISAYLPTQSPTYMSKCNRIYQTTPRITDAEVREAFAYAIDKVTEYLKNEEKQKRSGGVNDHRTPSLDGRQQLHSLVLDEPDMVKKGAEALQMEFATRYLADRFCLSSMEISAILPKIKVPNDVLPTNTCKLYRKCLKSNYRTIDGSCNNLKNTFWGRAFVCHLRFLPAAYSDGISAPRLNSITGVPLPPSRVVSTIAHIDIIDSSTHNGFVLVWGQFMNHDIASTPASRVRGGGFVNCCKSPNHPQCLQIRLPPDDPQTLYHNRTCMNMVRSALCPLCSLGPRQQINSVTSFLDLSTVYGSDYETLKRLRKYTDGQLRTSPDRYGRPILPRSEIKDEDQCIDPKVVCFDGGDIRLNQHPGLTLMHTMWVRRHNQHAIGLKHVNPHWSDEKLFQEARRMTIAEWQHITYTEYLPIILGKEAMNYYRVSVPTSDFCFYDPNIDPTTWNEYITAAGRFGHSQIFSKFSLVPNLNITMDNKKLSNFKLRHSYFDPTILYDGYMDPFVKGLLNDRTMEADPYMSQDVRNHLYRVKEKSVGNDLAALNVQRGRDHGMPPYYVLLNFCFGFVAKSWDDLENFVPSPQLRQMKRIYHDWRDIDLFTGGISERKLPDAEVGPTFACIIGIQFNHLKMGDRFFYLHKGQTGSFTLAQIEDMRRTFSLANFLCKTADNLQAVPVNAFYPASASNPLIKCKDMPWLNHLLYKG